MQAMMHAKINSLLENISNTPELIRAFKDDDTLQVLYKNGINLNATETLVLSDIVKGTKVTFMSNKIDDLRKKWELISKDLRLIDEGK